MFEGRDRKLEKEIELSLDQENRLTKVGKALSSEVRIQILKLLCQLELNVNEIAEKLEIPASSAAIHVKVLEEAGLIETKLMPGIRGSKKLCCKIVERIAIELFSEEDLKQQTEVIRMPIGSFVDYKVEPTCGIVSENGPIDEEDEPRCFYNPRRYEAQLLWFGMGYVEYRFPNTFLKTRVPKTLEISAELCSETHEYELEWPSDITVWMNGIEVGTWECPSDFGGRRGKLNPAWWPDKNTQYGKLKTWRITENASYLDGVQSNKAGLSDYHLDAQDYISVRIGVKDDAVHRGGVNLFGECFGDHAQNLVLKIFYNPRKQK